MNILAIDGSPRGAGGVTALVLKPFLEGLGNAELVHTKDLDIRPCKGDFVCWHRTPGECHQDDDMRLVLERIAAADVLVLATPLYVDGMSGPLKNLLDRMIPLLEPEFVLRDGHCRHPLREGEGGLEKLEPKLLMGFLVQKYAVHAVKQYRTAST
jgi:multimeric flavodoxin WrbA